MKKETIYSANVLNMIKSNVETGYVQLNIESFLSYI